MNPEWRPRRNSIDVSVVIPMYNAVETIGDCLSSVFSNRGSNYEVIVVDDASTDSSLEIALVFPCRVVSMDSNVMAANCRNVGASHAIGDYLFFFDADQIMKSDTIHRFHEALLARPDFDALVGSFESQTNAPGFFSKFKNLRHHFVHRSANTEGSTLASGLTIIRSKVFSENGGFESSYQSSSIEDIALGYRLTRNGHRILFRPDLHVSHLKRYTFTSLVLSDIRDRAIPWTQVIIRDRIWKNDLNLKQGNSVCVALAWLVPLSLPLLDFVSGALAATAGMLLITALNRRLLTIAYAEFGLAFLLYSILFIPFMYFYQGLGALLGIVLHIGGLSLIKGKRIDTTKYRLFERGTLGSRFEPNSPELE